MTRFVALFCILPFSPIHAGEPQLHRSEVPFTLADVCTASRSDCGVDVGYVAIAAKCSDEGVLIDGKRMYSSPVSGGISLAKYFSDHVPVNSLKAWDRAGKRLSDDEVISRTAQTCRAFLVRRDISREDSAILEYFDPEILLIRVNARASESQTDGSNSK